MALKEHLPSLEFVLHNPATPPSDFGHVPFAKLLSLLRWAVGQALC